MARNIEAWMRDMERNVAAARRAGAHTMAAVSQEVDRKVGDAVREISGIPTFPIEIRTSTAIYVDERGRNMGRVDFDFPDVVRTTDGRPVSVVQYELEGYKESLVPADAEPVWEVYGTSGSSSITRMELDTYTTYVFRIRAAGGLWSDAITVKTAHDSEPPPQPTAPQLTVSHGTITVKWDKLAVTGEMPADFSHIIVASGTASAPDKETYRLDRDVPFYVHTDAPYMTPVFFRFRAVDNSGNLSPWSEQATAFTTPLVDTDVILTEIDAGKTRIINAGKIALDANTTLDSKLKANDAALAETKTSLTGPGGLTSRLVAAEGKLANAGALVLADGVTLSKKLADNAAAITTAQGQLTTLKDTTVPKLNTDLTAATGRLTTAEGKITTAQSDLTTTQTDLAAAKKSITDNAAVMNGAVTRLGTAEGEITAAKTRLTAAEGAVATLRDTTVPKLGTDLTAATGRLTTAEGKITTAQADLATAKTDIDAAEKAITDNAAVMNGAVTRLGTAEGEITAAKTRLTTAEGAVATLRDTTVPALNTSLSAATGRLTTAEGKLTTAEGRLTTAQSDLTKLTGRVSPLETGLNTLTTTTIPALQTSIDGKSTIHRGTTDPANNNAIYKNGDRYEKWSTLATGGKLLATWRHDGARWYGEAMDASYLPLVDIGSGTFGSLSGGRLTVGSVAADRVMIGQGENLLVDPSFEDPTISARRASSSAAWSWVQDTLGGSYMFTESTTLGDMQLGNASNGETFPIDPQGAMAFTIDAEGPDLLAVYLQVRYADGTAATGPYLKDLKTGGTRKTVTVQWDFATMAKSATGSPPVTTRPILRRKAPTATVTGANKVYSVRYAPATKGELIVNGTITGDHVDAESVAAKVGSFLSLTTDQLTAGSANLGDAVARKIAAGTAAFQTVDAKNLFVTGTSSLGEVVARRLAAETGTFMTLTTNQLTAGSAVLDTAVAQKIAAATAAFQKADISNLTAGTANMTQAVIDKLVANTAAFQKVTVDNITATATANLNTMVAQRIAAGTASFQTVDAKNLFVTGTSSLNEVVAKRFAADTGEFLTLTTDQLTAGAANINSLVAQKIAAGTAAFQKADISNLTAGSANMTQAVIDKLVANTAAFQTVKVDNITATATANLNTVVAQRIAAGTASFQTVDAKNLFVTGTASLNEAVAKRFAADTGSFLELGVEQLKVTGTANLKEAVADKLFANIFSTRKLLASQVLIGPGANLIGDPRFDEVQATMKLGNSGVGWDTYKSGKITAVRYRSTTADGFFYPLGFSNASTADKALWTECSPLDEYVYSCQIYSSAGTQYRVYANVMLDDETVVSVQSDRGWVTTTAGGNFHFKFPAKAAKFGLTIQIQQTTADAWFAIYGASHSLIQKLDDRMIVDGGIVAKHITASEELSAKAGQFLTLGVDKLTVVGTANLQTAVADRMFANLFSTRKLTAQQVYIGDGGNLFTAELDDPAWGRGSGIEFFANGGRTGGTSLRIPATTTQTGTYFGAAAADRLKMPKLVPGAKYRVRVSFRSDTIIAPGNVALYLRLYGPTGTAYTWAGGSSVSNIAYLPVGDWGEIDGILQVPADSVNLYGAVGLYSQAGATGAITFSDLIIQEAITPELIVDGAVTTKKLTVTEEMTVELLKAHKVLAGEINVNSLSADTAFIGSMRTNILTADVIKSAMIDTDAVIADLIKADAITAKHTITGALHRTAASGARTEMTKDGVRVLNASGIEQVKLGYGLETGLAVLNPYTSKMTSLQNHVFGTQFLSGSFMNSTNDSGGTSSVDTFDRFLKSSVGGTDLTFTAQSDKVMIILSFELNAWLATGMDRSKEVCEGTATMTVKGANGQADPSYQNLASPFGNSFPVPYGMMDWYQFTMVQRVFALVPGRQYRISVKFGNGDTVTNHSRIYWGSGAAVVMPI